jgi:hypothetical protein
MIQALAALLARLCIWVVGLPAVSLETRRSEAAKAARENVALMIGYRDEFDEGDAVAAPATGDGGGGESIEARGLGFGEYLMPVCDCEDDDADDDDGQAVRS